MDMTDNRTNEPTEAQVERAAQAIYNHSETTDDGMICTGGPDEGIQCDTYMGGDQAMHQARAALTAAGVTPQEPSECQESSESDNRRKQMSLPLERWAKRVTEALPAQAAPVEVDEAKLGDVIKEASVDWQFSDSSGPKADYIARAVVEWLRERGGESRGER